MSLARLLVLIALILMIVATLAAFGAIAMNAAAIGFLSFCFLLASLLL